LPSLIVTVVADMALWLRPDERSGEFSVVFKAACERPPTFVIVRQSSRCTGIARRSCANLRRSSPRLQSLLPVNNLLQPCR